MKPNKEAILNQLKDIKNDMDIPIEFKCLGKMEDVYPDLPQEVLECYRTWIWQWKDDESFRIATCDLGNSYCSYICEGTTEELIKNLSSNEEVLS
ncbi:MAG: hypothetical protein IJ880_03730 [Bacilli bacterium]|nr:hypothetical protein [Bacilli bacterium]MBR3119797.1 hypothetical protein [Oceanobacillus sp.]